MSFNSPKSIRGIDALSVRVYYYSRGVELLVCTAVLTRVLVVIHSCLLEWSLPKLYVCVKSIFLSFDFTLAL